MRTPRDAAEAMERATFAFPSGEETHVGYGVMGQPFSSGHVLALRRFVASSLGAPYTSVWHRDPSGAWSTFSDAEPSLSCPRYFVRALTRTELAPIELAWSDERSLRVRVGERIDWRMRLGSTTSTRAMSAMARAMPASAWRSRIVLLAMGSGGGAMLGAGRLRMVGSTPNGGWYRLAPRRMWAVVEAEATLDGVELGKPSRLPTQPHLGELALPQRGIFAIGHSSFETVR